MTPTGPDRHDDDVVRLLRAADPLRNWTLPPMLRTPEDARRATRWRLPRLRPNVHRPRGPVRSRRPQALAGGSIIVAVLLWLGGGAVIMPNARPGDPGPSGLTSPTAAGPSASARPGIRLVAYTPAELPREDIDEDAAGMLRQLMSDITGPEAPPGRKVTYVRLQEWGLNLTDPHPPKLLVAQDRQVWWNAERYAYTRTTTLPGQKPDRVRADYTGKLPAGFTFTGYHDIPDGSSDSGITVLIPDPSEDPRNLAGQLAASHPGGTPRQLIRAVGALYRQHHLGNAERAAVLDVLAAAGLRYWGKVTDRKGRPGIAVGTESTVKGMGPDHKPVTYTVRDMLVIDTSSGNLLAYEETALAPLGPVDDETGSAPGKVIHYVLYLENEKVSRIPGLR
ncbi:hypothetical protein ACFQO7_22745 [Catellatospora aurea]|uniref:CU044_5270 family protein n=1 Tax=Catellatospora aurea TaxID=1337874 RepID=A0ABW2H2T6_9ACTN